MPEKVKPPLGVEPHWMIYPQRIKSLNDAIARQIDFIENSCTSTEDASSMFLQISKWSKEMQRLSKLESKLQTNKYL